MIWLLTQCFKLISFFTYIISYRHVIILLLCSVGSSTSRNFQSVWSRRYTSFIFRLCRHADVQVMKSLRQAIRSPQSVFRCPLLLAWCSDHLNCLLLQLVHGNYPYEKFIARWFSRQDHRTWGHWIRARMCCEDTCISADIFTIFDARHSTSHVKIKLMHVFVFAGWCYRAL